MIKDTLFPEGPFSCPLSRPLSCLCATSLTYRISIAVTGQDWMMYKTALGVADQDSCYKDSPFFCGENVVKD